MTESRPMEQADTRGATGDARDAAALRSFRSGCFALQFTNSLASSYYFNYLFFYLKEHFGFSSRANLCISALYGFVYMWTAWFAGPFGKKHGYFRTLKLGFAGMLAGMVIGALAPELLKDEKLIVVIEVLVVIGWTAAVCVTWPTLQYLLSRRQTPQQLSRTAGLYNISWSGAAALAYLTSGALLDFGSGLKKFGIGGEILFWLPALMHIGQLAWLPKIEKLARLIPSVSEKSSAKVETAADKEPVATPRAKMFLHLAWVANPFAYVAIYGLLPVIPALARDFGLTATMAGFVCCIWFWARLVAFLGCWLWTKWHYHFEWLAVSFLVAIGGFVAILLATKLWVLILAQVVFGFAIGLIYYSSLFYSMDTGSSSGKKGGFHEAAIGLGILIGPGSGVVALYVSPAKPNAATWTMTGMMLVGLALFAWVRIRSADRIGKSVKSQD